MNPTTEITIIPGGLKTAISYEYHGGSICKPRNETLRWFDEQEEKHAARCCSSSEDRP